MVTKAEYEELNNKYKEAVKLLREQSKNLKRLSMREMELEKEVSFHKNLFRDMKSMAEQSGSEVAGFKQENIRLIEKIEGLKSELMVKK